MSCLNLASKTIMITNASTSFAFCVAQHLARNGANVFLTDQDERRLNYTLNGLKQSDIPNEKFTGIAANLEVEEDRKLFFTKVYFLISKIINFIFFNLALCSKQMYRFIDSYEQAKSSPRQYYGSLRIRFQEGKNETKTH